MPSHGIYHPQRWRVEMGPMERNFDIDENILEGIEDGETKRLLGCRSARE